MEEHNKRIPQNQGKLLFNLQQKIAFVSDHCEMENGKTIYGDSEENLTEEHPFAAISQLLDEVLILLGKSLNTCTYVRKLNGLMTFVNDKKNFEQWSQKLIRENSQDLID